MKEPLQIIDFLMNNHLSLTPVTEEETTYLCWTIPINKADIALELFKELCKYTANDRLELELRERSDVQSVVWYDKTTQENKSYNYAIKDYHSLIVGDVYLAIHFPGRDSFEKNSGSIRITVQ